ncbi:hypothetical protein CesoFtcFv8_001664 [Champsocephalus esox]|uniref:Uncharacterized protein n=1 Tax=Champsocephalus esox TaxID=159716 RepID=A0AAN8D544_9TELE|nr:hypothetical protein CesoFtcFv8_001664 [Champsocephalus esox]
MAHTHSSFSPRNNSHVEQNQNKRLDTRITFPISQSTYSAAVSQPQVPQPAPGPPGPTASPRSPRSPSQPQVPQPAPGPPGPTASPRSHSLLRLLGWNRGKPSGLKRLSVGESGRDKVRAASSATLNPHRSALSTHWSHMDRPRAFC